MSLRTHVLFGCLVLATPALAKAQTPPPDTAAHEVLKTLGIEDLAERKKNARKLDAAGRRELERKLSSGSIRLLVTRTPRPDQDLKKFGEIVDETLNALEAREQNEAVIEKNLAALGISSADLIEQLAWQGVPARWPKLFADTRGTTDATSVGTKAVGAAGVATAADPVAELLQLLTEIAIERAKREGLALAQDHLRIAVCDIKIKFERDEPPALPNTCKLLGTTSLDRIVADPTLLRDALISDVAGVVTREALKGLPRSADATAFRALVSALLNILQEGLRRHPPGFTEQDACIITHALVDGAWLPAHFQELPEEVRLGLLAGITCLTQQGICPGAAPGSTKNCDFAALVRQIAKEQGWTETPEAARIGQLVLRSGRADEGNEAARARLHASVELLTLLASHVKWQDQTLASLTPLIGKLALAIVDANEAQIVAVGATILAKLATGAEAGADCSAIKDPKDPAGAALRRKRCRQIEKAADLLAAITSYAETFADPDKKPDPAAIREQRKQILENVIDKVTVRVNRGGESIFSIGAPVGFAGGWQRLRQAGAGGDFAFQSAQTMRPQLDLSIGLAWQRLPGKTDGSTPPGTWDWTGIHAMLTIFDVGQLLAYDQNGVVARTQWQSLLAPGLQVGWAFGKPQSLIILGIQGKYSPTLFADTEGVTGTAGTSTPTRGAVRYGMFVAYYVPFLDLN